IQTDKAVMPLESFDEGVVAVLLAQVGDEVAVGKPVMILAAKGEDPKAISASSGVAKTPAVASAAKAEPEVKHGAQGPAAPYREMTRSRTRPEVSNGQERHAATAAEVHQGGRIKSSPLARKIAASAKVDLGQIPPTGPGGRVIRRDVEAFLAS